MVELIKIELRNGENSVSARELHSFLQVGKKFADWIKDKIEKYDLQEGLEFFPILGKTPSEVGGRPSTEYYLTVDCAKELCMIENNAQGKAARRYFIEVERKAREAVAKHGALVSYGVDTINGVSIRYAVAGGVKWSYTRDLLRTGGAKNPSTKAYRNQPYSRQMELVGIHGAVWCVDEFGAKLLALRTRSRAALQLSLFDQDTKGGYYA